MANQPDEHKDPEIPPVFNDEETRKRIDEHLSDPDSIITEDDIRNINTELNPRYKVDPDSLQNDPDKKVDTEETDKKVDHGEEPKHTPWEILGD